MGSRLLIPVIMCGGAGTRLWPVSRESMPKQFVPLVEARSTFQQVLGRIGDATMFDRPIVITHSDFRFIAAEQMRECGIEGDIVLEPIRGDSAMAVGVAAVLAAARDPASTAIVLAADHVIRDPEAFARACRDAMSAAANGRIVTFGIRPTFPATNYGYIRPGAKLDGGSAFAVDAFVEKPDAATAGRYIADRYLWNSGNFLFRADVMLGEIARFEPDIAAAAKAAVGGMTKDLDFLRLPAEAFGEAPKKSIDYAVMERTERAAVVPLDCGWSDVGVDNLVVVATPDAVLVTSRDKAEQVKELVERLKAQNREQAKTHLRIYRPWGYYQGVDAGARYQVKRIVVNPNAMLSLQKHFKRSEHWVVVRGVAEVTIGTDIRTIAENESIYIPIGGVHRLANPGTLPLELIEVQVGDYLGEDDIERLTDQYGRD